MDEKVHQWKVSVLGLGNLQVFWLSDAVGIHRPANPEKMDEMIAIAEAGLQDIQLGKRIFEETQVNPTSPLNNYFLVLWKTESPNFSTFNHQNRIFNQQFHRSL